MTDWREAFPDDSRVSWERRLEAAAGSDDWALAARFVAAWREDSTSTRARMLEAYVARIEGVSLSRRFPRVKTLSVTEGDAIQRMIQATQTVLRASVVGALTLSRGQPTAPAWRVGDEIEIRGRGLTCWTPDRAIAVGHSSRRRPGVVLALQIPVDHVALAFDPSSDGEIVIAGRLVATVATLVT